MQKSGLLATFFGPGRLGTLILFLSLTVGLGEVLAQRSMTEDYEQAPKFRIPTVQSSVAAAFPLGDGEGGFEGGLFGYIKLSNTFAIRPGVDFFTGASDLSVRANGGVSWFLAFSRSSALELNGNFGYFVSVPSGTNLSAFSPRFSTSILFAQSGIGVFVTSIFGTAMGGAQLSYHF